jgi:hypothetical protein
MAAFVATLAACGSDHSPSPVTPDTDTTNVLPDTADKGPTSPYPVTNLAGHRYQLFRDTTDSTWTWADADSICKAKTGYLADIESIEENDFLFAYMKDQGVQSAYFGYVRDSVQKDTWHWVSGSTSTFTNWAPGEPNNYGGHENYAEFYLGYPNGTWNDGDFGAATYLDTRAFICEWVK